MTVDVGDQDPLPTKIIIIIIISMQMKSLNLENRTSIQHDTILNVWFSIPASTGHFLCGNSWYELQIKALFRKKNYRLRQTSMTMKV